MAEFLGLKDGTWTVMEGSYDASLLVEDKDVEKDQSKISVMYSGVLDLRYGIRELLDAFDKLDDGYELWLTGNGNAVTPNFSSTTMSALLIKWETTVGRILPERIAISANAAPQQN